MERAQWFFDGGVNLMKGAGTHEPPDLGAVRRALELLEAAADADAVELTRAYRRQARRLHPDLSGDPEATERFRALNAAYRLALQATVAVAAPRSAPSTAPPHSRLTEADEQRRRTQVPDASQWVTGVTTPDDGVWVVAGPVQVDAATTPGASGGTRGRRR
jgi:hypothetical protein